MMFAPTKLSHLRYSSSSIPTEMSATSAALRRLHGLSEQHRQYKEKLEHQRDELRRLQEQLSQTKTVVELTLPGEMKKAQQEYLNTM